MKRLIIVLPLLLQACAYHIYSGASAATGIATGKTLTDRAVRSVVPNGDCNVTNILDSKYYCEIQDPTRTYNRNPL
jgi:hypothetical protein